jgi:DNA polymerase-3 subunit alpha
MAKAGAFDFDPRYHRAQYFKSDDEGKSGIELALKFGATVQSNKLSGQGSLFGGAEDSAVPREPKLPEVERMPLLEELREEEEVVGIFLSKHPLDTLRFEYDMITTCGLKEMAEMQNRTSNSNFVVMGIVTSSRETISQKGEPFGRFTVMDYTGSHEFALFGKDYLKFKPMLGKDYILVIKGSFEYSERNQKTYTRFHEMVLSSDIQKETLIKSVQVDMDLHDMLKGKAAALETIMLQYPGNCILWIHLMDNEDSMGVKMVAAKGFEFCNETIQIMEDMEVRFTKRLDERWHPVSPPPSQRKY